MRKLSSLVVLVVQSLSHVQLFVTPWTVARQAPLPMGFPGKNTGVGCHSFSRGSSWLRDRTHISCIARWILFRWATRKALWSICSVQFSCSVMSNSLRPREPQHSRPPCPSPTSGVHSNLRPLSQWCHPTISSSVVPFSSCPQSFPASGSFQMSQLFASGGQVPPKTHMG